MATDAGIPVPADARSGLAARQAALVAALVGSGELPAGFDAGRTQATARSLALKRARAVAAAWTGLAHALGETFEPRFAAFTASTRLPHSGGPLADGRAFARWLAEHGELPEAGLIEALAVDARFAQTAAGLAPRRLPALKVAWLADSRQLGMALWLPRLGARSWRVAIF